MDTSITSQRLKASPHDAGRPAVPGPRFPRRSARGGAALALVAVLCLAACSKSEVTGKVFLPVAPKQFKPAGLIQVMLVKGDVLADLRRMAKEFDGKTAEEASKQVLPKLQKDKETKAAELATAQAAVAEAKLAVPAEAENCLATAQDQAAAAEQRYRKFLAGMAPQLATLHIQGEEPEPILKAVEASLAARMEERARQLKDEYVANRVTVRSQLVSEGGRAGRAAGSTSWDKICWIATNTGDLNLISADLYFTYNGKRIPADIAGEFWQVSEPLQGLLLRTRDKQGNEVRGVPAGESLDLCFYGRRPALTAEQLPLAERYGLSNSASSRSGNWVLGAEHVTLTDAPAVKVGPSATSAAEFPVRPLTDVFAQELTEFRDRLPEAGLLDRLTTSDVASDRVRTAAALGACEKVVGLQADLTVLAAAVTSLEKGKTTDPEARRQLATLVTKLKEEKKTAMVAKGRELIDRGRVAAHDSAVDGTFVFDNLANGAYTLVSSNKVPTTGAWVTWIAPIQVRGHVQQDLTPDVMREGSLADVIGALLLSAEPEAKEKPKPAEPAAGGPERKEAQPGKEAPPDKK